MKMLEYANRTYVPHGGGGGGGVLYVIATNIW